MKKIVIIANSCSGLYDFRAKLINQMLQKGYAVTAIIPYDDTVDELKKLGVKPVESFIDRRGTKIIADIHLLLNYIKIIRKEIPDLIITYTVKPNIYGGLAAQFLKIPYAANITGLGTAFQRDGILRILVLLLYRIALKRAKVVFFENSDNCKFLRKNHIIQKKQYCILHGAGVDLERYSLLPYPKKENPIRFLFIGRIMEEKGINELFEAMRCLISENQNCVLDVLGRLEEEYITIIKQYEKEGWLYYHGYQSDIRPYIEKSHCFVLPSYHEGMANTNLENAASGRPLIVTDIPGCREAVIENVSGFLCVPQNMESLCNAMKKFVNLSQSEREKMGVIGRKYMEKNFDKATVVKKTIKALDI